MENIILIGAGGHSKVIQGIVHLTENLNLYAIVDDAFRETITKNDVILAPTDFLNTIDMSNYKFCIAIGSNLVRQKLFNKLNIPIEHFIPLIHPHSTISSSADIGFGTVVMAGVVINADAVIGDHCIINTGAIIEHDNTLSDYVHISPNATLAGTVTVGEGSQVGAGATVIQGKRVGDWSMVGAGAVVIDDVDDDVTVVGVPAKLINTK